jgi:hypothetical protein
MNAASQHEVSCADIAARGCSAGALGGGLMALAVLFAGSAVTGDMGEMAWAVSVVPLGGAAGGLQGLMSGLILACRERGHPRSDRDRRATAAVLSVVAWAMFGWLLVAVSEGIDVGGTLVVLALALVGAAAGAALAPCVVKGSTPVEFVHRP